MFDLYIQYVEGKTQILWPLRKSTKLLNHAMKTWEMKSHSHVWELKMLEIYIV